MGISPLPLLSFDSNSIHGNEEMSESKGMRRMKKARHVRGRRPRSVLMKIRARQEGFRKPVNSIEKKVKTLKKLIRNNESMGLDGLFRETAEYILSLQMRVKVMQIMMKVLTGSNESIDDIHL